jgi:hypothetical protein
MKWTTKAFIQRILSNMPGGKNIYYLGQFYVGGLRRFTIEDKVQQCGRMLKGLQESNVAVADLSSVEIGTGWVPVVPLFFWLFGQKECNTYDISRLLTQSLVVEAAKQLLNHPIAETLPSHADGVREFEKRKQSLKSLIAANAGGNDILEYCGIHYHAKADAAKTQLPSASIDIVYSNTVFEHVPQQELAGLFAESRRILQPSGYILHLIDMSDHFAHSDPSISPINFLQFSEKSFTKYNSYFLYQNRLRVSAWRQIITEQGFEIVYWQPNVDEKALKHLTLLHLDEAFENLKADEICTSSVCVLARKV